ncbi:MAG TPA: precorrin-4 C(11)-methyltransferase [Candidatus Faecalibacterium faecipullorum]|uniref:Precorrin-4 C(11)-methyltransferase n=1 Tax=Candidatus Faecalibacterium faecipullorum TaxID=2838578 RepID=A0A9D2MF11_9FIRM|nr:precorrin-4 C(11)-methyltransferase [Candidatus Faecalibacterium faecipullorum]
MVHFVGAGPGAPDLLTLRGAGLLRQAGCVIYAGSLVNPALLALAPDGCRIYNSAEMTLEQVLDAISAAEADGLDTVRLHTGDPCVYGAVREQMDALDARGIGWDDTPGVSSFCAAAAALGAEYTLPGVSQSVIITRLAGRTPVPEQESLAALASHGASMVIFLSAGMLDRVQAELLAGGAYAPSTPAALVYKASWPEERLARCTVGSLAAAGEEHGIRATALVLVGDFLSPGGYERSKLYDPAFTTGWRQGER